MWWAISGDALLAALHRVEDGESADITYLELLANSDTEAVDG